MRILVAGATGSIGLHVVNTAIKMGHQPVALIRNKRKVKSLPRGTDFFTAMFHRLKHSPIYRKILMPSSSRSVPMARGVLVPGR